MANADRPRGFQPLGEIQETQVATAGGTIRQHDPVVLGAGGTVTVAVGTEGTPGTIYGVALHRASSGDKVLLSVGANQLYIIQADGSEIDNQNDIGQVCDFVNATPSPDFGVSNAELDSSAAGTGGSQQCTIVGIDQRPDNALGANVDCIVRINENQAWKDGFAGI